MDLPGRNDIGCSEQAIHLPDYWVCYDPITESPELNDLPAAGNGFITFGSLNNFCKTNDAVLMLWAKLMARMPDSQLMLLCAHGLHRKRTADFLESNGVASKRVEFVAPVPRMEYLRLYHRIDIGLDPFPYNGITTTCDALWMGVPVMSIAGLWPASRAGLGILSTIGLPELISTDENEFVNKVAELSNDFPRLTTLRSTLRDRMKTSPLTDGARFARNMETLYRTIWQRWCARA